MEVPGLEMLKPRSSYPLLAGPGLMLRGLESKQFRCSIIKLESRALESAPSFYAETLLQVFCSGGVRLQHLWLPLTLPKA